MPLFKDFFQAINLPLLEPPKWRQQLPHVLVICARGRGQGMIHGPQQPVEALPPLPNTSLVIQASKLQIDRHTPVSVVIGRSVELFKESPQAAFNPSDLRLTFVREPFAGRRTPQCLGGCPHGAHHAAQGPEFMAQAVVHHAPTRSFRDDLAEPV
jgi:hypothetical protein